MQFIGLDLAWSPRNRSGGAVLSAEGHVVRACTLGGDEEILAFVEACLPDGCPGVVAVDAPLAVPNAQGRRTCDQELTTVFARFEAGPYPANRSNLGRYGGLRAEGLRLHLQERGFRHDPQIDARWPTRRVVEVFPHPAIVSLFGLERTLKYKPRVGRDYGTRWSELARLRDGLARLADADPPLHLPPEVAEMPIEGRRGGDLKGAEDVLDAVVCAYSALYAWHHGPRGAAVYGLPAGDTAEEGEPGHILVPMTATMWERIQSRAGRLLFLAGDGLLKRGADGRMPDRPEAVELLPGVGTLLRHYAALGWRLIALPDSGGAAPYSERMARPRPCIRPCWTPCPWRWTPATSALTTHRGRRPATPRLPWSLRAGRATAPTGSPLPGCPALGGKRRSWPRWRALRHGRRSAWPWGTGTTTGGRPRRRGCPFAGPASSSGDEAPSPRAGLSGRALS